ncbi:MAG: D-alanine--D-alanine ligase [Deltaproteobacteria bacterium]|nr:D-alanine--D-alanine ligase [Deltaproteobacteria bacterium]
MKIKVAVVMGGPSPECDVSLVTGAGVAEALRGLGYDVIEFLLNKNLPIVLQHANVDVVFPALHGPLGEDGCLQGLLEILEIPYVGSSVLGSALGMNKYVTKRMLSAVKVPTPKGLMFHVGDDLTTFLAQIAEYVGGPSLMVKPNRQGSALGASRVFKEEDLRPAIERSVTLGGDALVEEFIVGKEITVGVLEKDGECIALPVIEIHAKKEWYDYEARYTPGMSVHDCPAKLSAEMRQRLQTFAIQVHRVLECRHLSRVDFVVTDQDQLYVLEVNTIPGMTPTSLFPEAAQAHGISFSDLVDGLVQGALFQVPRR